jgi:hypothetical protein
MKHNKSPENETVPNTFGGQNSVLAVTDLPSVTHLAEAE